MTDKEIKVIVQKLLDDAISRDEFGTLCELVKNPATTSKTMEILELVGTEVESDKFGLLFMEESGKEVSHELLWLEILKIVGKQHNEHTSSLPGRKGSAHRGGTSN